MDTRPETITLTPGPALAIRDQVATEGLPAFFGGAFPELFACAGAQAAGPPFARYHHFDVKTVDVEVIVPVRAPVAGTGRIHAIELTGGPAVQIQHVGPYEQLSETYATMERWIADHHQVRTDAIREVYLTSPGEVRDPGQWITLVVQPVAPGP